VARKVPATMLTSAILLKQNVGDIIVNSGPVGVVVLLTVTVLSVVSWAITLDKARAFKKSRRQTKRFLRMLPRDFSIFEAEDYTRGSERSSLARLLLEAATSVKADVALMKKSREASLETVVQSAKGAMERATAMITDEMESRIIFLATTASACPFLGLFGTVWGVMVSFLSMGHVGSASLAVVGPGVATALIATIFGLGAAIPALVAYNYFVNAVRRENAEMQAFESRVTERLAREVQGELSSSKISL
jgi:biopolymer transport protein TolQ